MKIAFQYKITDKATEILTLEKFKSLVNSEEIRNLAYTKIKSKANENINNKRAKCVIEALIKTTNNKAEIARKLNENGFTTSKGGKFTSIQVIRLIQRYNIHL